MNAAYYYITPQNPGTLFQGDIIRNFPVTVLPPQLRIFRSGSERQVLPEADVPDAFQEGPEDILAKAHKTDVMVLSQSCDVQQREFVIVAPIQPMNQVTNENRKRAIRDGKVNYRFWLPEAAGTLAESFVELTILNSVPRDTLKAENRVLCLSDAARHHLADILYRLFCRPFYPDS